MTMKSASRPAVRWGGAVVIVVSWLGSLALPALYMSFDSRTVRKLSGFEVLTSGWFGLLWGQPAWLADASLMLTIAALTSWSFRLRTLLVAAIASPLLAAASADLVLRPHLNGFHGFGPGFYLWFFSMLMAAAVSVVIVKREGD